MNKRVLISIINWNSSATTLNCVKMLKQQDYPHKKIVVVDNASRPDDLMQLRQGIPEEVEIVQAHENCGYAGGHAHALNYAENGQYDFFWFLNTDLILRPQVLSILMRAYEQFGDAVYGCVPLQARTDTVLENYRVLFHHKFFQPEYREILFDLKPNIPFGELLPDKLPRKVAAVTGSSVFIPMAVIRKHGFMDTSYFMYSEEIDYCFRLNRAGVASIVVPEAYVLHEREGSSKSYKQLHSIINYYRLRNQLIRIKRYGNRFDLLQAVIKNLLLIVSYLPGGVTGLEKARFGLEAVRDGLCGNLGKTYAPEDYLD